MTINFFEEIKYELNYINDIINIIDRYSNGLLLDKNHKYYITIKLLSKTFEKQIKNQKTNRIDYIKSFITMMSGRKLEIKKEKKEEEPKLNDIHLFTEYIFSKMLKKNNN